MDKDVIKKRENNERMDGERWERKKKRKRMWELKSEIKQWRNNDNEIEDKWFKSTWSVMFSPLQMPSGSCSVSVVTSIFLRGHPLVAHNYL